MSDARTYKVVLEYEVTEVHQAVVFVTAGNPQEAEKLARAVDEAGEAPWDLESEYAGETCVTECEVAAPEELAA